MTTARHPTTDETVTFSTQPTVYLTAAEIAAIEDDPLLTLTDVIGYRAGGSR